MRHFLQYHNPDRMGPYEPSDGSFGILTNKLIAIPGDAVWLVTRSDRPRVYSICSWFIVDHSKRTRAGRFSRQVLGTKGRHFQPHVAIDTKPWFQELLKKSANFSISFHRIKNKEIIDDLEQILAS